MLAMIADSLPSQGQSCYLTVMAQLATLGQQLGGLVKPPN